MMDGVPPLPLAAAAAAAVAQRPAAVELAVKCASKQMGLLHSNEQRSHSAAPTCGHWMPCRARKAAIAKTLGTKGLRHKWLRLDAEGDTLVLTTNKSSLTARLGVQVLYWLF